MEGSAVMDWYEVLQVIAGGWIALVVLYAFVEITLLVLFNRR